MLTRDKNNLFQYTTITLMIGICFLIIYPLWYTLIHSFNDGRDIIVNGPIYWIPRAFTLENYSVVFSDDTILTSFGITFLRTIIGASTHVYFTAMIAFALMRRDLIGRKIWLGMGITTLFFSGGLIPTFILFRSLGLIDTFWVYIFPNLFSFFDCIIFMNFFKTVPPSLSESAKIDGANDFLIFNRIILPLSGPVIATIALWNGIFNWNDYFYGVIFIFRNEWLLPIQTFLFRIIATTRAQSQLAMFGGGVMRINTTTEALRMATMVVTTVPIIIIYPFLQKYFTQGMIIGSIKE